MTDVEKFTKGPERDAVEAAKARWGHAQLAWVGAGKPERGPECAEMVSAYQAMEAAMDALHLAAFGVSFPRQGRAA